MSIRNLLTVFVLLATPVFVFADADQSPPAPRLAILSFGNSATAVMTRDALIANMRQSDLTLIDPDLAQAAARGAGYSGSLNLSLAEARDLGAALGCDFFLIGDAQTLRRSPSTGALFFESYASIFLVSARTGRLVHWIRPAKVKSEAKQAEHELFGELSSVETRQKVVSEIAAAQDAERNERAFSIDHRAPVIEVAPDDEKQAEVEGLRLPRAFRRLMPPYPDTAADAEAEATVDVLVDIDEKGDVKRVEVARWAGFGLDEATVKTVQRLQFFPAMRNGVATPLRVLLRYNFRKPPK